MVVAVKVDVDVDVTVVNSEAAVELPRSFLKTIDGVLVTLAPVVFRTVGDGPLESYVCALLLELLWAD